MNYYIFDTQQEALDAVAAIGVAAAPLFSLLGNSFIGVNIVPKRNGVNVPEMAAPLVWATPRQRLDGKWIIPDIGNYSGAQTVLPDNTLAVDAMRSVLPAWTQETDPEDGLWFVQVTV
jgi:hypothetical protein